MIFGAKIQIFQKLILEHKESRENSNDTILMIFGAKIEIFKKITIELKIASFGVKIQMIQF